MTGLSNVVGACFGGDHYLAVKSDGTVWAWGNNQFGQLGNGTTSGSWTPTPAQVAGLTNVTAVAAGGGFSLALCSDGTVRAWGYNGIGQCGDGTTTNRTAPVTVSGMTNVTAIAATDGASFALKSDGSVWSWGGNLHAVLGNGPGQSLPPFTTQPGPVVDSASVPIGNVRGIAGGRDHALAVKFDGTVWTWGRSQEGQLGHGSTIGPYPFAVQVVSANGGPAFTGATAVAAGGNHCLALKSDGTVWAWGADGVGQLGDNNNQNRSVPAQTIGLSGAARIAAGGGSSFAMKSNGELWVWGYPVPFGGSVNESRVPVLATGLSGPIAGASASHQGFGGIAFTEVPAPPPSGPTVTLVDSANQPLSGGTARYYANGWHDLGATPATVNLPPGSYTFQVSYGGATQQKTQNIGTNPSVVFQTRAVTVDLNSSTGSPLTGTAQYYANGWHPMGNTPAMIELLPLSYSFQITYGGASQQKTQNTANDPNVSFQTTRVQTELQSSTGAALSGTAQYYANGWHTLGATPATAELLPLSYSFQISYGGASEQKTQNVATDATVVFQTTLVTAEVKSSTGAALSGTARYYANGWHTLGTTPTSAELLPLSYSFQVTYGGGSQQKTQNVGSNANVLFQTAAVQVALNSSTGAPLVGTAQYYADGWHTLGTTPVTAELLPLSYAFQVSYGGATQQKTQNIGTNPNVVFQTRAVTVALNSSTGSPLTGTAQYYANGWHPMGNTPATVELLPVSYSFQLTYGGASQQKTQNAATDPNILFQTTLVTVELQSMSGAPLAGAAQYYANGWHTLGTTTATIELLPVSYTFKVTFGGQTQQKTQNVGSNANVVFQTTLVAVRPDRQFASPRGGQAPRGASRRPMVAHLPPINPGHRRWERFAASVTQPCCTPVDSHISA